MQAEFTVDATEALSFLERFGKQGRYAQAVAINRTVEEAMAEGRAMILRTMTVRAPRFILPPIQLPRTARADAKRDRLYAAIQLGYDDGGRQSIGARRSFMLSKFETGGRKVMRDSNYPVAIPTKELRSSASVLVPRKLYPRNILGSFDQFGQLAGLGRQARTKLGRKRKDGTRSTKQVGRYFMLGGPTSKFWGAYERTGPKSTDVKRLWTFKTSVPVPKRLDYYATAQRIVNDRFWPNLEGALELALRTAK